jgi:hypothetical protein
MDNPIVQQRVIEYRKLASADTLAEAKLLGLNQQETKEYLFDADSNAIWDAQAGYPYTKFLYRKAETIGGPMYTELGFLSDEEYKLVTGKNRQK